MSDKVRIRLQIVIYVMLCLIAVHLNETDRPQFISNCILSLKSAKRPPRLTFPDTYMDLVHNPSMRRCRTGEPHQDMASGTEKIYM